MHFPPMRARRVRASGRILALVAATTLAAGCGQGGKEAPQGAPPKVLVTPVLQKDVPVYFEAAGQTRGSVEVDIRARIEGYLESINFREGAALKKGDLMYVIEPQEYEAALARARADLAQAEAEAGKAVRDAARMKPLAEQNAVSKQELDNAVAAQEATAARVTAMQAAVRNAELNLSYTRITSPLDGVAGISQVSVGNLVGRGQSTLLTTVSQVDPIWVRFSVPERAFLEYRRKAPEIEQVDPVIRLVLSDGSIYDQNGRFRAAEMVVDPATGSVTIEAEFPNPTGIIRPGQFGRVQALVEIRKGALLVPQRAVNELQGSFIVAVVKDDDTVETRPVTPGNRFGSWWVIDRGVNAGERVVVEGQWRLKPGMKVTTEPAPVDSLPAELGH